MADAQQSGGTTAPAVHRIYDGYTVAKGDQEKASFYAKDVTEVKGATGGGLEVARRLALSESEGAKIATAPAVKAAPAPPTAKRKAKR